MIMNVPDDVGPKAGVSDDTARGVINVQRSAPVVAEGPPRERVAVTSTVAAASSGPGAVIDVSELTTRRVAAALPNRIALALVKWLPVIVMTVPPVVGPKFGLSDDTAGGVMKVNWSAAKVVVVPPPATVTVISTVPAALAGAVATIDVSEL